MPLKRKETAREIVERSGRPTFHNSTKVIPSDAPIEVDLLGCDWVEFAFHHYACQSLSVEDAVRHHESWQARSIAELEFDEANVLE